MRWPAADPARRAAVRRQHAARLALAALVGAAGLARGQDGSALFVDGDGRVGIGTERPAATLDVKGRIRDEGGFVAPAGIIVMWSGREDEVPDGWVLCDGRDGTPDLRGRFVVGAEPGNPAGRSGEPDSHAHELADDQFGLVGSEAGRHDHQTATRYWYTNRTYGAGTGRTVVDARGTSVDQERTSADGVHVHELKLDPNRRRTGSSDGQNRPRWYALGFIMKR